jgi:flavin-dependent dehydrogenase
MNNRSAIRNPKVKILVVGAGPAGSSLAIRLSILGFKVTLIERERFPRHKLCGEFISPECFRHFDELGVRKSMFSKGGDRITETRFFSPRGRSVAVPTTWFGSGDFALSVSRAEMDLRLLLRAREAGVEVFEGCRVTDVKLSNDRVLSMTARTDDGNRFEIGADLFIDATGRPAALTKLVDRQSERKKASLIGFKAHLSGVEMKRGICEIYFFNGGYGGLSHIEAEQANFCFLIKADVARKFIGKTNELFGHIQDQNRRAGETLRNAVTAVDWIGVPVDGFGSKPQASIINLFAAGDAGAFIDPFTGSGILMALESSELLAKCFARNADDPQAITTEYRALHHNFFRKRLAVSQVLRHAAFMTKAASGAIFLARQSSYLRGLLARATRSGFTHIDEGG